MSDHVAVLRITALSIFAGLASLSFPAQAQLADVPGEKLEGPAPDFTSYDCAASTAGLERHHTGQVIAGRYREWVTLSKSGPNGRDIRCVSELTPEPRALSSADARALLAASSGLSAAPAAARERAASLEGPLAPTFEHGSAVGVATSGHALNDIGNVKDYAILDGGFGTTPVGTAPLAKAAAATDVSAAQVPRERTAAIGTDERTRVPATGESPWNTIGQLQVTWRDGTQSICTGTLISPHAVLTAGQCAHNRSKGGFAARTSFAPGLSQDGANGIVSEVAAPSRYADYVETTSRWTQISGDESILVTDARSDYAVYYFLSPWTHPMTLLPLTFDAAENAVGNHAGYPTSVAGIKGINQGMFYAAGAETNRSALLRSIQVREFGFDVSTGAIGGPIWTYDGTSRKFIGIVSYGGDDYAGGVWFGGDNKALISAWAAWRPGQSSPQMPRPQLNVPFTFPSSTNFALSLFRFYNPGLVSGRVAVTFRHGTTGQELGTWTSPPLPPRTSKQFLVKEMEEQAVPPINAAGKDNYTATISPDFQGFVQTVIWNQGGLSLTNASGCSNGLADDVSNLINVHTTQITQYPSVILIHNLANRASDAVIGVYDARKGDRLGGIVVPAIAPNAAASFGAADIERVLNYTPYFGHDHYNLVIENDFYGYAQHFVYNNGAGLVLNMTAKCLMRPVM
ncbi:MAG: serine protease [Rhodospirillaceae bacterium]